MDADGDDALRGRTDLERIASLRVATSAHARQVVRRQMIGSGVVSASTILVAGALDRWVHNTWAWAAIYAVSLYAALRVLRNLEDTEAVRVKPARRVVLGAAAVNVVGLLVIMIFLRDGGLGTYAAAAAVGLGSWSVAGWWLSR